MLQPMDLLQARGYGGHLRRDTLSDLSKTAKVGRGQGKPDFL